MAHPDYERALSRSDLSQWLVHFVRESSLISPFKIANAQEILHSIFTEGRIRASRSRQIVRYDNAGAACFYDAPPSSWQEIIQTNPNRRVALGIICNKTSFWYLGGRPAIYTDQDDPEIWPPGEKFRVIHTDLMRQPQPIDWMHEREWRIRGDLRLQQSGWSTTWWWPIVPNRQWCQFLFSQYPGIGSVYVLESGQTVDRSTQHVE